MYICKVFGIFNFKDNLKLFFNRTRIWFAWVKLTEPINMSWASAVLQVLCKLSHLVWIWYPYFTDKKVENQRDQWGYQNTNSVSSLGFLLLYHNPNMWNYIYGVSAPDLLCRAPAGPLREDTRDLENIQRFRERWIKWFFRNTILKTITCLRITCIYSS